MYREATQGAIGLGSLLSKPTCLTLINFIFQ